MRSLFRKIDLSFYREALALALPIAFQNLLTSCATLIDTAMVVGLGNAETSAMGVAARFTFLLNIVCFGISSGCAALLSQYWGAKDLENTRRSLGFALMVAMIFGLVYMGAMALFPEQLLRIFNDDPLIISLAAGYMRMFAPGIPFLVFSQILCVALRAVQNVRLPLISSAVSVVVNTSLNYCFINGHFGFPRLELRGAALASAIGCAVQTLIILIALVVTKNPFRTSLGKLFRFDRPFCRKYIKVASPVLLNETMWGIGTNIYAMVLARQGTENHAGYTLYENMQQLFFVFFVGICGACSIMVGMRIGRGDHEGGYRAAKRFAVMTPIMGVILGTILILVRNPLLSLFPVETDAARTVASQCLLFYGFWIAIRMIPYTMICGIFRAGGDTKAGCILDLLGLYGFGIPAVLIVGLLVKPTLFVWLIVAMFVGEDTIKGILCVLHFRSRRWIKQLTKKEDAPQINE
ncbi:MAG: MATE family efflux transporter [Clostridia bacterium]|nr:MATE family efflux transporter [Clostridia bacterium]